MAEFKQGRPTDKVRNLRRFTEQWQDFTDNTMPLTEFDAADVAIVNDILCPSGVGMDRYNALADAVSMEV